ncbi:hypothetical protein PN497_05040 [Sphaerospermopsis kisseleviana CS-549]|uniref:Uncharacterized protein n=1 Tax=Sphaerospermopsis kisseleviana CS-549 TaxID=3021783 RepID=A0ABT4ZNZ1_9CYAN|nr:hypothetical protein [Sphaerospermopsis kisseleviana]MDB9440730.1 hypothetical protein [Sphaerospermopsis kisseleviana CS-549]BAZ82519.1 hypothetical protein NIES73_38010 [Sphaerospermopsis kisseleviana NIES-73]
MELSQIIENTTTNTSNIHYEIEDRFFAKPYEIENQTTSNYEVNHEVDTRQKKQILILIRTIVGLFIAGIIIGIIYRSYTKPCTAGEKKNLGFGV